VSAWFEYAKNQVESRMPYLDFQVFEICVKFNSESSSLLIGQKYVEEAFKHPTTEKEYGKLDSTEFYHEKCYELYLIECAKDKKSPMSREEFYRENVWTVPKCLAEQREVATDGESAKPRDGNSQNTYSAGPDAVSIDQLDERTSVAVWFRYAEGEVKEKRSYLQYPVFLKKVSEDEKAGLVDESVRGFIKDGFRNSTIEKGYEELNVAELHYELNYVLYVDTCVRDGKIPCDREKYYLNYYKYGPTERVKNRPDGVAVATIGKTPSTECVPARGADSSGRGEPRADGTSENPVPPKQSAVGIDMLDEYTKVAVWAKYSEDLINNGERIYNFGDFVDWAKEAESKGSLPPDLKGYIEKGIKFPATEKDYGKLSPEEFRHKKDYDLECLFRRLHYKCPVSIEEYYRKKGWPVPDSLKKRRDDYMGK
ncbi:MAG: hypothetical protein LUD47_04400, partial [Clostridia bacterium]|nr:hypothetical protein [Clostridia bacterium]